MAIVNLNQLGASDFVGAEHGASVSIIISEPRRGGGPRLHRHPYDETWFVQEGRIVFVSGEDEVVAGPGDIVVVPPNTPHKFTNVEGGPARLVCIHASPRFDTEWLE